MDLDHIKAKLFGFQGGGTEGVGDSADFFFNKALSSYDQGYKIKDIYNETFNELYRDDIVYELSKKK